MNTPKTIHVTARVDTEAVRAAILEARAEAWEEGRQAERCNMEAYEACPLGMTPKRKTNPYREES